MLVHASLAYNRNPDKTRCVCVCVCALLTSFTLFPLLSSLPIPPCPPISQDSPHSLPLFSPTPTFGLNSLTRRNRFAKYPVTSSDDCDTNDTDFNVDSSAVGVVSTSISMITPTNTSTLRSVSTVCSIPMFSHKMSSGSGASST